ncbi:MAG: 2-oxoacid:acceptor oxidoreductase family protein [FCB group bacterium]|nr:2-oxoacid:acceptor oxidoreductase family protein [FCB group bacterium]
MLEIRFHSRGGQGGVIAGKLLAVAFDKEGKFVQTFPSFGVERRAAPVQTFLRIDDRPIRIRNQVYAPDMLIVLDPSLITFTPVLAGLKDGGKIIINTEKTSADFDFSDMYETVTVNASKIALDHKLGSMTQPIVNTAILGAFAKITGLVSIESVIEAIVGDIPVKPEENAAAAREAYESAPAMSHQAESETPG